MDEALRNQWRMTQQDQRISEAINREYARLRHFIRKRVADQADAEDILQEVFSELIEAYRMMKPVEQVTAWLFRVARNRTPGPRLDSRAIVGRRRRRRRRRGGVPAGCHSIQPFTHRDVVAITGGAAPIRLVARR